MLEVSFRTLFAILDADFLIFHHFLQVFHGQHLGIVFIRGGNTSDASFCKIGL